MVAGFRFRVACYGLRLGFAGCKLVVLGDWELKLCWCGCGSPVAVCCCNKLFSGDRVIMVFDLGMGGVITE